MEYVVGNCVRCRGEFEDENGDFIDPTTVTFKYKDPANEVTSYVYGTDGQLVQDSVGHYHADVAVDTHGVWFYRFESTGSAKAADEKNFTVQDSEFS